MLVLVLLLILVRMLVRVLASFCAAHSKARTHAREKPAHSRGETCTQYRVQCGWGARAGETNCLTQFDAGAIVQQSLGREDL